MSNMKKLWRNPAKGHVGGVCHGIGVYTDVDPVIIRALMFLGMSLGTPLIYLGLWAVLKKHTYDVL